MGGRKCRRTGRRRRFLRRAMLSLVSHQLADPRRAVTEAFRSLADDERAVVRTVAPEDVTAGGAKSILSLDVSRRCRPDAATQRWRRPARDAGFIVIGLRRILRRKKFDPADEGRKLLVEVTDAAHSFLDRSGTRVGAMCGSRRRRTAQLGSARARHPCSLPAEQGRCSFNHEPLLSPESSNTSPAFGTFARSRLVTTSPSPSVIYHASTSPSRASYRACRAQCDQPPLVGSWRSRPARASPQEPWPARGKGRLEW